jgi:glucan endo-1,3-beta-D-glucosidase
MLTTLLALVTASLLPGAGAGAVMGFNSASTKSDGTPKMQADFEAEFKLAAGLEGAPGTFNSVRLYTNIQGGSTADPLDAFPAAVATNTTLLLGIWASGTDTIQNELAALGAGIQQFGDAFTNLVIGVSVGSEDLYRGSATGVANQAGIGADPAVLANFIDETRAFLQNTTLANVPIGHVDTFNVWGNASNAAVLNAVDFLGIDAYPFYESNLGDNSIDAALGLWNAAMAEVKGSAAGKPVWITETGWPSKGAVWGQAEPTVDNAKQYWDQIGCSLFGVTNVWWYVLLDENMSDTANFSVSLDGTTTPVWNLTCPIVDASSSTASATGTATSTGKATGVKGTSTSKSTSSTTSTANTSGAMLVGPHALAAVLLAAFAASFAF